MPEPAPITDSIDALTLRALERAIARQQSRGATGQVATELVAAQLARREDRERWAATMTSVGVSLKSLARLGLVEKHTAANRSLSWSVTADGVAELAKLKNITPRLADSAERREWEDRRTVAEQRVTDTRARIRAFVDQLLAAVDGDDPDALEHPDPSDSRNLSGVLDDDIDVLQAALRAAAEPAPIEEL